MIFQRYKSGSVAPFLQSSMAPQYPWDKVQPPYVAYRALREAHYSGLIFLHPPPFALFTGLP